MKTICNRLREIVDKCDHAEKLREIIFDKENSDQLEPSFMCSVLFKEIILEIEENDDQAMKDLVVYCRSKGIPEEQLQKFQNEYHEQTAVYWYTYPFFLSGMLDESLRSLDMECMSKMGFFIRSLHRQLERLHNEQLEAYKEQFCLYYSQGFSAEHFDKLIRSKGGLLSFNNFLLTTMERTDAMEFLQKTLRTNRDQKGILFIIPIAQSDVFTSSVPFAFIREYSAIPNRAELLFAMHTVFRINDVRSMPGNDHLWEVQLTLTSEASDPDLNALTDHVRQELDGTGWYALGQLMLCMGQVNEAEKLYNQLLDAAASDSERADICDQLGRAKQSNGEYQAAISLFEQSFDLKRKSAPENDPSLASACNNIAQACIHIRDYTKALEYYEKSLEIRKKVLPPTHPDLATTYSSIGWLHNDMGNYSIALGFLEKAVAIWQESLTPADPEIESATDKIVELKKKLLTFL